jgi:intracellular multiplication protein IcmB
VELWALSTSSEDVEVRSRLYVALGAPAARQILSQFFPGGTARHEIRRRVVLRTEKGEIESGATSVVITELVEELTTYARNQKVNR